VKTEDDQTLVASILASRPPPDVSADFVSRVNARIDETAGWFGLADFRVWTFRLAPAAAALALLAILWPGSAATGVAPAPEAAAATTGSIAAATSFSPATAGDWQRDVSADALLDAALHPAPGAARAR
jgi:hypothetical protein